MESSPLTLAQTHARKAAKADSHTAAIDEHDQAAGQFAKAAKDTINSEALRTLQLLEQHHRKLASIIKFRAKNATIHEHAATKFKASTPDQDANNTKQTHAPQVKSVRPPEAQGPAVLQRSSRDVGSSIASNLASARGIPVNRQRKSGSASSPTVTQQNAEGKIVSPPRQNKLGEGSVQNQTSGVVTEKTQHALQPPANIKSGVKQEKAAQGPEQGSKTDEPFNRFYSTVETLFSKLYAPLAYAGLPLNPESEAPTKEPPQSQKPRSSMSKIPSKSRATASPEYSRFFSPAAIRALREESGTTAVNTTESFYVVPTSGHTLPYASILARHPQSHGQMRSMAERNEDELSDEFVDARESPSHSPQMSRKGAAAVRSKGGKTLEELELENTGLRSICDELSRRLWQFEVSSQMSQQALHQSIRAGLRSSPAASVASGSGGADVEARVKVLEKEMGGMRKENEKLKGVVNQYRERWEKLKENAIKRRKGTDNSTASRDEGE